LPDQDTLPKKPVYVKPTFLPQDYASEAMQKMLLAVKAWPKRQREGKSLPRRRRGKGGEGWEGDYREGNGRRGGKGCKDDRVLSQDTPSPFPSKQREDQTIIFFFFPPFLLGLGRGGRGTGFVGPGETDLREADHRRLWGDIKQIVRGSHC
jgi:hypothetical protein